MSQPAIPQNSKNASTQGGLTENLLLNPVPEVAPKGSQMMDGKVWQRRKKHQRDEAELESLDAALAGNENVDAAPGMFVGNDVPLLLAQAEAAVEGSVSSSASGTGVGSASVAAEGGVFSGGMGIVAAAAGLAAIAAASRNSGGSDDVTQTPTPTESGTVIDGYLSGATVFIDTDADGQLDAGEPNTVTDLQGNFTLPADVTGNLVAMGGTDISTGLPFVGVLRAPAGSTVVTPLTTLVNELMGNGATAAQAQESVLKALGLEALNSKLDLTTFDPLAQPAGDADALALQKASVTVATLVSNLTSKLQELTGAADSLQDEIAFDVFGELSELLSNNGLLGDALESTAGSLIDALAGRTSVGGQPLTAEDKTALAAEKTFLVESIGGFAEDLNEVTELGAIGDLQKEALTNTTYTLQLLHFADAEAGMLASGTAPYLAAMADKFEDEYANSITLAGGDNFIPGPFMAAGTDAAIRSIFNQITGSNITGTMPVGAVDIALHNLIGVEASAIGNHEFDLGSNTLGGAFKPTASYTGAQFPFVSANLDFSGDNDLKGSFVDTTAVAGLEKASDYQGKIVPSAILEEGGAKIGLVGATTQILESISSPSGTQVKDDDDITSDDLDLLAAQLQPVIDDLVAQGVNKIILLSHLQLLGNELALAGKLSGVDIILAAGSNTRLGDADDQAVAFPGHAASFADTYPVQRTDKDGNPTLIVNTDNEFTYLGRLVVDFDAGGKIITDSLTANQAINGAYASTAENAAEAWNVTTEQLATTAFAEGTRGGNVKALTDAVQDVILVKDGNVYGHSNVYLEGERTQVRSQETNLGNLSADANGYVAEQALGAAAAETFIVSLKNGGGIRTQIGTLSAPKSDGTVDKLPPDGGVSQLDVENSLRFNNQLIMFDTTPEGLKAILEHGVAAGTLQGRFPQLGGIAFAWDPDLPAGARVSDIALIGDGYTVNLYDDGVLLDGVPQSISVVTLSFLANGGDSYPIKDNGVNFRYLIQNEDGSYALTSPVDESLNLTVSTSVPGGLTPLGEQAAFEAYMKAFHATPETAFDAADTPMSGDTRIQNLDFRSEDVLADPAPMLLNSSVDGLGDVLTLYFDQALDAGNPPSVAQFSVDNGGAQTISSLQVVNNQVILKLATALNPANPVSVSFTDPALKGDDVQTIQSASGIDAASFANVAVDNWLQLDASLSEAFAQAATLQLAGAEISAFDPASGRLFVTSFAGLQVVSVDSQLHMQLLGTLTLGSNDINSVAVKNGIVAVAVAAADKTQPGSVYFLDADASVTDPAMMLGNVSVGALPDMLTFTADGKKVLVANEAEQDAAGNNPEGSVSIIDLSAGAASASVTTASFAAFNGKLAELQAAGVRLFAGEAGFENITVAQDLEPEYISIAPDGLTAFVTLQENNAIGILDIANGEFTDIVPLGLKSFSNLPFDGSDRDGAGNATSVKLQTGSPVYGQYMPDSIASFTGADGKAYFVIANEGDDRDDFITPGETARVSSLNLDPTAFPDAAALKTNAEIGRLTVSQAPGNNGDTDGDGDIDQILAYGARSFTILNADGVIVFDSGSHIEQFVAAGGVFNANDPAGSGLFDDTRSDNKGPEPEGITIGHVGDKTLAFVGLERGGGGVMVYDVTNPTDVAFVQYLRNPADVSPEGLTFVSAANSPSGSDLLFVTNEVSNTVSLYQNANDDIAPMLVSSSPADDAVGVTSHHIILTFNEAVIAGVGNIVISGSNGTDTDTRTIAVDDVTQVTISGSSVDINPGADLLNGYSYNVQLASGVIKDAAGNAFAGITTPTDLNFTRAVPGVSTLLITELNSNADGGDFFEIYNYGATAVDLSGWKWDDNSAAFNDPAAASFANGTTIAAGGRLIVAASATDTAALKTAWGLGSDVPVVALGGPGLGSGDAVVLFNAAGNVVTSFNYGTAISASDGSPIATAAAAPGVTFVAGHAGTAFGGSQQTSAVWDGVSTSAPAYMAAQAGVNGGFAQPAIATTIGSPGIVTGSSTPDTTAPQLSNAQPADDATGVAVTNNIVLTFNETVKAGSGNFVITNTENTSDTRTIAVDDATQISFSGTSVTLNPGQDLLFGATYSVTFAAGAVEDMAGNDHAGVTDPTTLNFTTGAAPLPSLLISEVNSNAGPADFFEIYNYGTTTVDLSGWKWDDESAAFSDAAAVSFANGTTLAAGGRLVVVAAADAASFKTAWGLGDDVSVLATGGPGLGSGDAVVLFNAAGQMVTSFNYSGTAKTASDGSTVAPSTAATGVTFASGHAGAAFGGTATTSAVWDGVSTSDPAYKSAAVGVDGGYAQTSAAANIGSPGQVFGEIAAPTLGFSAPGNSFDLANYTLSGRYSLPVDPTGQNKLAHEASGVAYNWDTGTLFIVGDGGTSVAQVSKQGVLIDSMALATGDSPQGTYFYDMEGIAYIGNGKFVFVEERDREFNEFTYVGGNTLGADSGVRTVKLGTTIGNVGIEGMSFDPLSGGFIAVKEATPVGVFQTTVDFAAGTASNGAPTTVNSDNLFDPALTTLSTHNDVFALANILTSNAPDYSHLLVLSAPDGKVVKVDREGNVMGSLSISTAAKNEGITMDDAGNIYIVGEEGGGNIDTPELLVYSPTTGSHAVGLGSNLYLTFNQPVFAGSGNIVLSNGAGDVRNIAVNDSAQISFNGGTVTINPTNDLLLGTTYSISYDAGVFKDGHANAVAASSSTGLDFSTFSDDQAPVLASSSPADDAGFVGVGQSLTLTFNEAVKAGSGNFVVTNTADAGDTRTIAVTDAAQVTFSEGVVTLNPTSDLLPSANYSVTFASGVIKDLAGNDFAGILNADTLNFSTAGETTTLAAGDILFVAGNAEAPDAIAFVLLKDISGGTSIDFSDRDYDASNGFAGLTNEAAFRWTADQHYAAGTIVTIQTDSGVNPVADKGSTLGAGGGVGKSETYYAFQGGTIAGLADGAAGIISNSGTMLASLTLGGSAGAIPEELVAAGSAKNFMIDPANQTNARYIGSLDASDIAALAARIKDTNNWEANYTKAPGFALLDGSFYGAPLLTDASVNGTSLTLTWNTALDTANLPDAGQFAITANATTVAVNSVAASGTSLSPTLTLTLAQAVIGGDAVALSYSDATTGNDVQAIQLPSGADAPSFSGQSVRNLSPDGAAPILISALPADEATDVATAADLTLTFNEPVAKGSGNITLKGLDGASDVVIAIGSNEISISGATLTINPTAALAADKQYAVQVDAGAITDIAGNPFAGVADNATLNFTTASRQNHSLLISEVNSNGTGGDFFELYNYGTTAIDLSGWKWTDEAAAFDSATAVFPSETTLAAGARLLVAGATDAVEFKTAWELGDSIPVLAVGGPGLGKQDAVVVFDSNGFVATAFNYDTDSISASDGSLITTAATSAGQTFRDGQHAGTAYNDGSTAVDKRSAVWDGMSFTQPAYEAASVGVEGAVAQSGDAVTIGSPGQIPTLDVGDLVFLAANGDSTDAFAFAMLQAVAAGQEIGFTDRNYSTSTGMPASGESAYVWTADHAYEAGTVVTIQPDQSGNPLADKGTVQGKGGGISTSAETIYAFLGEIAGLAEGAAEVITIDKLLASLNVGGGAAGDVPDSIAATSMSFAQDNVKFDGELDFTDINTLVTNLSNSSNWATDDLASYLLTNNSLFTLG